MEQKLPYYRVYPYPYQERGDMNENLERSYTWGLCSLRMRQMRPIIEDELDTLEYEGSMLYDEYPDRIRLKMLCHRIYQRIVAEMGDVPEDIVEVLVFEELRERRRLHRKREK